ncbi:hypothetical protein BST61_g2748 [Cercospora zeina]
MSGRYWKKESPELSPIHNTRMRCGRIIGITVGICAILLFVSFGVFHLILVICGHNSVSRALYAQSLRGCTPEGGVYDIDQPTKNTMPIPCHSHNDYWRDIPLLDAIHAGCTSVEADIWLDESSGQLDVGHHRVGLSTNHTLQKLYIELILELLDQQNPANGSSKSGIFPRAPNQTLTLLLDFKSDPSALLPHVLDEIEALEQRSYLSHCENDHFITGPVTIVATGLIPPQLSSESLGPNRTIFTDLPLDTLEILPDAPLNTSHAPVATHLCRPDGGSYASTSFRSSIGGVTRGGFSATQLAKIRKLVATAHEAGLKARYWDTPAWPTSLRNYVWQTLVDEGVDVLNVDDLCAAAFLDWRAVGHGMGDG